MNKYKDLHLNENMLLMDYPWNAFLSYLEMHYN